MEETFPVDAALIFSLLKTALNTVISEVTTMSPIVNSMAIFGGGAENELDGCDLFMLDEDLDANLTGFVKTDCWVEDFGFSVEIILESTMLSSGTAFAEAIVGDFEGLFKMEFLIVSSMFTSLMAATLKN